MRVGSIGYATCQGLGLLLKDFYDNGVVTDIVTVHQRCYTNYDWYRGPVTNIKGFDSQVCREFIRSMDTMFFFETPFDRGLIDHCRNIGVKTVLMPMYECYRDDWGTPDVIINPSLLDQAYFPRGKFIPVPVPRWVKWREREQAKVFVHNAGHGGLKGRNGTLELLRAMEHVKSPIRLIVRSQDPVRLRLPPITRKRIEKDKRVEFQIGNLPKEELYEEGDVFIFPEKFNGLSLPLQEAKAAGMLVMATDRFPINTWTNQDPLIPVSGKRKTRILSLSIDEAIVSPRDIASTIDKWYGQDIRSYSFEGRVFGNTMTWESLKPVYLGEITHTVAV